MAASPRLFRVRLGSLSRGCRGVVATTDEARAVDSGQRPTLQMVPRTGREKGGDARIARQGPWIFRNEVANVKELRALGHTAVLANVENSEGRELGTAMCNLATGGATTVNILGRMLTDNVAVEIDSKFFATRVKRALQHREQMFPGQTYYRLINGEGDLLPGVFCDRYGDVLCLQFTSLAAELLFRSELLSAFEAVLSPRAIVVRCDARDDRLLETAEIKLPEVVRGSYAEKTEVPSENGFTFCCDLLSEGWTSGAFFAERQLRKLVACTAKQLSTSSLINKVGRGTMKGSKGNVNGRPRRGKALSIFGESSGAFCASLGFQTTSVVAQWPGSSAMAYKQHIMSLASRNNCSEFLSFQTMGQEPRLEQLGGDELLGAFDMVTLEPPALAPTYGRVEEGMRLYTAWTALAASATKPGGTLLVASRSRAMTPVKLLRCINLGVWSAKRKAQLIHRSAHAGLDFPIHAALPDTKQMQLVGLRVQ
eukprot:TRINITY_DN47862_c0_g1_i1.p1 TRINITY_DN47862_c0_g1~~TRINITY_DN47862_c0_g1_i1.p1  ORF type:complete len:498 (-),score=74.91 TRINITY_DN47862_c0_g1_i1:75-1520(-)